MASLTAPLKVTRVPVFALSTWSVCFNSGNGQCPKFALGAQIICWFLLTTALCKVFVPICPNYKTNEAVNGKSGQE